MERRRQSDYELQELKTEFEKHEAVCEERWKTIFNEVRDGKEESKRRYDLISSSINSIHKLLLTVAGALILFLAGVLATGNVL